MDLSVAVACVRSELTSNRVIICGSIGHLLASNKNLLLNYYHKSFCFKEHKNDKKKI